MRTRPLPPPGFKSEAHRARFEEARDQARFGGPEQPQCGARTRGGGACRRIPLRGFHRCLGHAGPDAARAYRAEQFAAFGRGEITFEAWQRLEMRRAANRLRDQWKKAPWTPGATIDLGIHEPRFRDDLRHGGFDWHRLAPAVLDTARWRWRRLILDRRRDSEWQAFLATDLPGRVSRVGPMPFDHSDDAWGALDGPFKAEVRLPVHSRRRQVDQPRQAQTKDPKSKRFISKREIAARRDALDAVVLEHGRYLQSVLGRDASEDLMLQAAELLRRGIEKPDDAATGAAWRAMVSTVSARARANSAKLVVAKTVPAIQMDARQRS